MTTLEELQNETDKYKDTLIADIFEIKLFKRVVEKPDDFYYKYVDWCNNTILASCVGRFMPLIDRLDEEQYNYLVHIWNLNNEIQIKEV